MFIFFLLLTVFFGLVLVIGFAWGLIVRGKTTKRSGQDVGAEIMADKMDEGMQGPGKKTLFERTWFRGKGVEVDRESEYSYSEIKKMLVEGRFLDALPAMMLMAGIVGLTFFLGLTLITGAATLVPGLILLAFSVYAAYLILSGFITDAK
jgi:hypothetical protein